MKMKNNLFNPNKKEGEEIPPLSINNINLFIKVGIVLITFIFLFTIGYISIQKQAQSINISRLEELDKKVKELEYETNNLKDKLESLNIEKVEPKNKSKSEVPIKFERAATVFNTQENFIEEYSLTLNGDSIFIITINDDNEKVISTDKKSKFFVNKNNFKRVYNKVNSNWTFIIPYVDIVFETSNLENRIILYGENKIYDVAPNGALYINGKFVGTNRYYYNTLYAICTQIENQN